MTLSHTGVRSLLVSAEFARAYTLTTVGTMFGAFAIERLMSTVALVSIVLVLVIVGLVVLVLRREELSLLRLAPSSLIVFLLVAAASIAWSAEPGESFVNWLALAGFTLLAITVGHLRDTLQTVRAVGDVLRVALIVSLGLEILSGILLDLPIVFLDITGTITQGGPVQGIFGTRNLLGFVAMIAVITFVIEWRTRSVPAPIAVPSIGLAAFLALLSSSPTVLVLVVCVTVVALALAIVRRTPARSRSMVQWALAGLSLAALITAFAFRHPIIAWMGAGSGFSRRADLWNTILDFVSERTIQGWGWFGPWERGEFPFTYINFLLGERHRSALNAYFDTLLQLGIFGLMLFVLLGSIALVRSWLVASARRSVVYAWTPLILATLAIDSMFESFTLTGVGWFLLVLCALRAGQSRSWRENLDAAHTGAIPTLRSER